MSLTSLPPVRPAVVTLGGRSLLRTAVIVRVSGEFAHERTVLDVLNQRRSVRVRIDGRREQQLQQAFLRRVVPEP